MSKFKFNIYLSVRLSKRRNHLWVSTMMNLWRFNSLYLHLEICFVKWTFRIVEKFNSVSTLTLPHWVLLAEIVCLMHYFKQWILIILNYVFAFLKCKGKKLMAMLWSPLGYELSRYIRDEIFWEALRFSQDLIMWPVKIISWSAFELAV